MPIPTFKGELKQKVPVTVENPDGIAILRPKTNADIVVYSNNTSGLSATDVQGAIDEVEARVDVLEGEVPSGGAQPVFSDGSATIASISSDVVTLKAGVTQTGGTISNSSGADITLAKVAKTGAFSDLSGTSGVLQQSLLTTKGDIIVATANGVAGRVGIGTQGQVLSVGAGSTLSWISLPVGMQFKGTVGTGGTIEWSALPAAAAGNEGWMYAVITAHATAPVSKVGDTIVSNGTSWVVIPSGDEPSGTVTNIAADTGLTTADGQPITSSGTIKMNLRNSTLSTNSSAYVAGGSSKFYSVQLDKDGYPAVYVPWTDSGISGLVAKSDILEGSIDPSNGEIGFTAYSTQQTKLSFDKSSVNPSRTDRLNLNGNFYATNVYSQGNAVWYGTKTFSFLTGSDVLFDSGSDESISAPGTTTVNFKFKLKNVLDSTIDLTKGYSAFTVDRKGRITSVAQVFAVIDHGGSIADIAVGGLYFEKNQ